MDLLSHPFRLEPNGAIATVEDGTDEANAEGIAILALTRRGERTLVPEFGVPDPTFDELTIADLNMGLTDYGPAVDVTEFETSYPTDTTQTVRLTFETRDDEED